MDTKPAGSKRALGWMILYIALLIIGQQLFGIGGAIGGVFIAFGLNKAIRHPNYSNGKKVLYSVLYSIGGIAIAAIISLTLGIGLYHYFPALGQKSNIESGYQIPAGFTAYKNADIQISSLAYPTGWAIQEDEDQFQANFQAPGRIANVTVNLFALDEGQTLNLNTYTAELAEKVKTEPRISFVKVREEIQNINGKDLLIFDTIVGLKDSDQFYSNRTALLVTGKFDGAQYYQILMETDKEHFEEDSKILDTMVESLRFYN